MVFRLESPISPSPVKREPNMGSISPLLVQQESIPDKFSPLPLQHGIYIDIMSLLSLHPKRTWTLFYCKEPNVDIISPKFVHKSQTRINYYQTLPYPPQKPNMDIISPLLVQLEPKMIILHRRAPNIKSISLPLLPQEPSMDIIS